jgi:hypothetical protein
MAFTLAYGSFEPGTAVSAVPLRSLEPDDGQPPSGYVVGTGVADDFGAVTFASLLRNGEGPPDQNGSSLLRCVAVANANPSGPPRIVFYPRLTLTLQMQLGAGTLPTVRW